MVFQNYILTREHSQALEEGGKHTPGRESTVIKEIDMGLLQVAINFEDH